MKDCYLLRITVAASYLLCVYVHADFLSSGDIYWNGTAYAGGDPNVTGDSNLDFIVGKNSTGNFTLDGGSQFTSGVSSIASSYGSSYGWTAEYRSYYRSVGNATVEGSGTKWLNLGEMTVAGNGVGTLNILSGAVVETGSLVVGKSYYDTRSYHSTGGGYGHYHYFTLRGDGTINVDGLGSTLNVSQDLTLGVEGTGLLQVSNGAIVDVGGVTKTSTGSRYSFNNSRTVYGSGEIQMDSGVINTMGLEVDAEDISGNGTINTNGVIGAGYDLEFDGISTATFLITSAEGAVSTINIDANGNSDLGVDMLVTNGAKIKSLSGQLGQKSGSTVGATVTGVGSNWEVADNLNVGVLGTGSLSIDSGASVSSGDVVIGVNSGGLGTVSIDAANLQVSTALSVGYAGNGTMNVLSGGLVENESAKVGDQSSSTGVVTVDGAGSQWTTRDELHVGSYGDGTLNVTDQGTVNAYTTYIGSSKFSDPTTVTALGKVVVDGLGSSLNTNGLLIGEYGNGELVVRNQGVVDARGLTAGEAGGSASIEVLSGGILNTTQAILYSYAPNSNTVLIDGSGSEWNNAGRIQNGEITVQNNGVLNADSTQGGTDLNVSSGGVVNVTGSLYAGVHSFNGGTINVGTFEGQTLSNLSGNGTVNAAGVVGGDLGVLNFNGSNNFQTTLTDSVSLNVTADGSGDLGADMNVLGGAYVKSFRGRLGVETTSGNTILISGAGSTWEIDRDLDLGIWGSSLVEIENGGQLISQDADITATSEVIVTGAGSRWDNSDGIGGDGALSVSDGAHVQTGGLSVDDISIDSATIAVDGAASLQSLQLASGTFYANSLRDVTEASISGSGTVAGSGVVVTTSGTAIETLIFSGSDTYTQQFNTGSGLVDFVVQGDGRGALQGVDVTINNGADLAFADIGLSSIEIDGVTSSLVVSGSSVASPLTVKNGATVDVAGDVSGGVDFVNGGDLMSNDLKVNALGMSGLGSVTTHGLDGTGYADLIFNGSNSATFNLTNGRGDDINFEVIADGAGSLDDVGLSVLNGADLAFENVTLRDSGGQNVMSVDDGSSVTVNDILTLDGGSVELAANSNLHLGTLEADAIDVFGNGTIETHGLVGRDYDTLDFDGSSVAEIAVPNQGDNSVAILVTADGSGDLGTTWKASNAAVVKSRNGSLNAPVNLAEVGDVVTLKGDGTRWEVSEQLNVNYGELNIESGAKVSVGDSMTIGENGTVNIQVTDNGVLRVGTDGTGSLNNVGTLNLFSYATLAAGVYTPVEAGVLSGPGEVSAEFSAFGGIWDEQARTYTVGDIRDVSGGVIEFDLSGERLGFNSQAIVTSFTADAGTADFSAQNLSVDEIFGESVLDAYQFTTDLTGSDVLLSFYVGEGFNVTDLSFWHLADGESEWTLHEAENLSYVDGWANFTVSGFSGYAITAVPEPGAYALIAGLLGLSAVAQRRKRN